MSLIVMGAGLSKLIIATWAMFPIPSDATTNQEPAATTAPAPPTTTPAPERGDGDGADVQAKIQPRFELFIPSLKRLVSESRRSHSGLLAEHLAKMLTEVGSMSSEGVDVDSAVSLLRKVKDWPDTPIDAALYAADSEGRPRWAVRFSWPLDDLHARLDPLLSLEAAATLLEGVHLKSRPEGGYTLALPTTTLAHLLPAGESRSVLASHTDLEFPEEPFRGTEETEQDAPSLLVCRLNLKGTEQDSGATFWSSVEAVTNAVYACRVNEDGDWVEQVDVYWPPGIGMVAKAAMRQVKQTFFVPDEAYGSAVFNAVSGQAMIESMAGFGPQMMMDGAGGFTMVGEAQPGPITSYTGSEVCISVLPGTGFMPVPDVVIQLRAKKIEKFIEGTRETIERINELHRNRELPEPWQESDVRGRPVFWSDGGGFRGGMMMPFVMRPVLFLTKEVDAKDRERDFLVLGLTSTSPERLVRRWLDLPRAAEGRRYMPSQRKTRGQLWINWKQAYKWIQPYVNMSLSVVSQELLLPRMKDMADRLTDGLATVQIRYSGLSASHRGPMPAGVIVVPVLVGIAAEESGGTDLARERSACRKLKVLHHHATLFKKDMGRWPAELAELDGYVDFAGHPRLLKLELSSKKKRSLWMEDLLGSSEDEEEEEEEEEEAWVSLDDELFVIDWGRESWTLGIAPDTFEHLERLYVDQNGTIHRVEKKPSAKPEDPKEEE